MSGPRRRKKMEDAVTDRIPVTFVSGNSPLATGVMVDGGEPDAAPVFERIAAASELERPLALWARR